MAPPDERREVSGATAQLARFLCESTWDSIPAAVRHEAKRALLNWLGCALGGAHADAVDIAVDSVREFAGPGQATVINRSERFDAPHVALINAISSNVLDFDDTHLRTIIHPSVPVASALLALTERTPRNGAQLLHAFVLGVETECRIGNAMSPEHYDAGWHVTATCGVLGAAAACCKVLQLDAAQTTHALSMAASQAGGLSDMLGGMTRMLNMGRVARDGMLAALFAARGYTSSERGIEAPRGFLNAFSTRRDVGEIVHRLGETWELSANAYKPYPCGIVVHPVIDACLALRAEYQIAADSIECIELTVHPLVLKLTGNPAPINELQGKLSVHHSTAAAFIYGAVGVREFTDAVVIDPAVAALRARVQAHAGAEMAKDSAEVSVTLESGARYTRRVAHAKGSLELPMTDAELTDKFTALAQWGRCADRAQPLLSLLWSLDAAPDGAAIVRMTARP